MKALPLSLKTSTSCVGLHLLRLGQGLRNQQLLLIWQTLVLILSFHATAFTPTLTARLTWVVPFTF